MRLFLSLLLITQLCACELKNLFWPSDLFLDDLEMAREAHMQRDWPLAERLLARYLRDEQDAEKRWQAWTLLMEVVNAASEEPRASLECLEAMLVEYEDDDPKLAFVLEQMGNYNESLKNYGMAANAWSAYSDLETLSGEQRVQGLRRLAEAQLAERHFEAAEATLQQCLALPLPDHDKVWCMLDLADTAMSHGQWQEVADLCQQILDSEPDSEVMGLAGYLRADALEQLGRTRQALEQFEQAREVYPNPAVMDNRIAWLKKHLEEKK